MKLNKTQYKQNEIFLGLVLIFFLTSAITGLWLSLIISIIKFICF